MRIKKRNVVVLVFVFLSITTLGSYQYFKSHVQSASEVVVNKKDVNNLVNMTLPTAMKQDKISYLQKKYQNEDVEAVISIDDDDFSYPVVQTSDNEYYLTHDYYKNSDALGAIYADYRVHLNGGKKILIFGHSSTIRDTAFNHLEKYYDKDYFSNHRYLTLETSENTYHYEIFSVYVETSDFTYMNLNFDSSLKWLAHIKGLQAKSWYSTSTNLTEDDDILILQTCSNHQKYKNDKSKYLLIISRRVNE